MKYQYIYPFVALVGQQDLQEAILITLVNPKVGGLLLSGDKATAKSTALRAAMTMVGMEAVELPLSATEDRVFGHIDLEKTLAQGKRIFSPGLLADADGGYLYIDEINLLRQDLLAAVLQAHATKKNTVEREGLSHEHASDFVLIGSLNPQEGTLSDALLDKFGLFVQVPTLKEATEKQEVMKRVLAYEQDRMAFIARYRRETEALAAKVEEARRLIEKIVVPAPMLQLAAAYCEKAFIAGHRGDIILLEASKAIAALAGRSFLIPEDMERAAYFVLPHRMRQPEQEQPADADEPPQPPEEQAQQESQDDPNRQEEQERQEPQEVPDQSPNDAGGQNTEPEDRNDEEIEDAEERDESQGQGVLPPEVWQDIDKALAGLQMKVKMAMDRHHRSGSGKRQRTRTHLKQGRYIRAIPMGKGESDLALDATIRAAAPYQHWRDKGDLAVALYPDDLRRKVREKRTGSVFLFCVDASGSMGAKHRMGAVKGAIYGLLQDAYQKRDRVGLITFRRDRAEVLLPVTRSIDLAQKKLRELPTGGKTPLAAGLETALQVLSQLHYQDPDVRPIFILVTDGRATASLHGGNPVQEAILQAEKIGRAKLTTVVIDTETDFISMGIAKKIAKAMQAGYYHIQKLSDEKVLSVVSEWRG